MFVPAYLRKIISQICVCAVMVTVPAVLMSEPLYAAYKGGDASLLKGKRKLRLKEAVSTIKSFPRFAREAFYAEMLGLSYKSDGSTAMVASSQGKSSTHRGARFVGTDGKEHDWHSEYNAANSSKWEVAKASCVDVDVPVALSAFSRDITKMVHRTAKALLDEMPQELRDCWLAEEGGLCYVEGGASGYSGKQYVSRSEAGYDVPHPQLLPTARFTDTNGVEHKVFELLRSETGQKWVRRKDVLHTCAYLVGKQEIFDLFPKEMAQLSKYHMEKTEAGAGSKAGGSTATPETSATAETTSGALKLWPLAAREAFLVERLGLCYMKDGSSAYDSRAWVRQGARYISSDGKDSDWWSASNQMSDRDMWSKVSKLYEKEGFETVMTAMKDDVDRLKKAFAAHAPKKAQERANTTAMGSRSL